MICTKTPSTARTLNASDHAKPQHRNLDDSEKIWVNDAISCLCHSISDSLNLLGFWGSNRLAAYDIPVFALSIDLRYPRVREWDGEKTKSVSFDARFCNEKTSLLLDRVNQSFRMT